MIRNSSNFRFKGRNKDYDKIKDLKQRRNACFQKYRFSHDRKSCSSQTARRCSLVLSFQTLVSWMS